MRRFLLFSWAMVLAVVASFAQQVTQLPATLSTGCSNPAPVDHWEWTSPQFSLTEPISKFYMTVITNNTGDSGAGHPCFALAEMFVYDANGEKMELTVDNFGTNAQEPKQGPIAGICDGDLNTFFHSSWSSKDDNYHNVEVTLPQPTQSFSIGFITRNTRCVPVDIYVHESPLGETVADTCYIKNVGQQKYLSQGAAWGTHAVLSNQLMPIEVSKNAFGLYDLHIIEVSNGGNNKYLGTNCYVDSPAANWTFTEVEGGITISKDSLTFGWNGTELVLSADVAGADATWEIVSVEDYNAALALAMATATADAPVNATALIPYPDFMRNNAAYKNYWQGAGSLGGNNENYVMEHWNKNSNTYQEVTLPKGIYKLSVQGFYRYGNKADAIAQKAADGEPIVNAYLYAGEESAPMMSIFDNATLANDESIPNSMAEVSTAFSNGLYSDNALFFYLAEETTLNIGIKEEADVAGDWLIFDNFSLFYYGEEPPTQDDVDVILAQIPETPYDAVVKEEVETAKSAVEADLTPVTYANLVAAVDKAKVSAEWYAAQEPNIEAMKDLMASTNVYTAEAYDAYKALADEYFEQYSEGLLSSAVVNPNAVTGWRASTNYSQFLYSAWENAPHSFDNPLYINTWSSEGSNDGSNFTVPFFEYWTGDDGATLAARELTATVTGLTPGARYTVSALTRVRLSDSSEEAPAGICLQAGDGNPVSVTAGENVAGSRFYLGNFAANGCADAEGTLTIKYIIEEGNNISWLSFKNVKYSDYSYAGTYYVKNVDQQLYLSQGAAWGTHAVLSDQLMPIEIVQRDGNLYDLHVVNVKGNANDMIWLGTNCYVDADPVGWTFTETEGGAITISKDTLTFGWNGTELVVDENVTGAGTTWELISIDDYNAALAQAMAAASLTAPVNATGLIHYPDFMRNNDEYNNYWQGVGALGGNNDNYVMEHWNKNSNTYQEVTLPKGVYKLSVQGFYRYGNKADAIAQKAEGEPIVNAYLYAGNDSVPMLSIFDNETLANDESIPNSMTDASTAFSNGLYNNELIFYVPRETTLPIGIKEAADVAGDWLIFDNFHLTYYGDGEMLNPVTYLTEPTPGSTVKGSISAFTLTGDFIVNNGASAVLSHNDDEEDININATIVATDEGAIIELAEPAVIGGRYTLSISKGALTIEGFASLPATAGYTVQEIFDIYCTPDDGDTVETLSEITVACESGIDLTWTAGDVVVKDAEGETVATVAYVEYPDEWIEGYNVYDQLTLVLTEPVTVAGTYTVEIPENYFALGRKGDGANDAVTLTYNVEGAVNIHNVDIDVEHEIADNYEATYATADLQAACELLGIESVADASLYIVNVTTGLYVENETDGWRNADGDAELWGDNAYVCVKFDTTVSEDNIFICNMPGAAVTAGETYTAKWALATATDVVIYNVNVTFVAPKEPEIGEIEVVETITVNHSEAANTAYSGTGEEFDVNAVTEALGIDDIAKAKLYIMNVTDGSLVENTTDGWRNADGDAAEWGEEGGVRVNIQDPASGEIDYIGCIDKTHNAGEVYTAKWAFVYEGKAVVLEVVIAFGDGTGINNVLNGEAGKLDVYTIQGQKVLGNFNELPAGLYIVNGQKMIKK